MDERTVFAWSETPENGHDYFWTRPEGLGATFGMKRDSDVGHWAVWVTKNDGFGNKKAAKLFESRQEAEDWAASEADLIKAGQFVWEKP